ncbi:undecaprenyldiphospho-muramoylpentapeptide beta-N-acetylglucosaminyltransferase [Helicobacter monodelphidis]|uniref:undecaprenyldiphospho-muramoylpentapeptide beta-N-acetylglucosaminyltransferase n=1 Tax=Helicobacter sp. 15-1451 TaxID=2004995 RepID=UPI000DCE1DFE|nr:undecaprenyldiphospho-muramoylpentapeptide beta-N-acetylglucosaminyltransferase [Helicobacter sp. 15-1451]RAX56676.1 undecaprenyldiphospho-muramoylpentapeptide beta-N-acetylglucosaminyltransferase [Helicobacter sp. 15-1451]
MNILFTGGGTGGHLSVAKSVAEEIHLLGTHKLYYMGSTRGQDQQWFKESPLFKEKFFLESEGIVNKNLFTLPKAAFKQYKAAQQAKKIIQSSQIQAVFSVGGYSAAPGAFGAILNHTPLFIHEQNARIGLLNKTLKPFAREFYCSYTKDSPLRNYPVSKVFFDTQRQRTEIKKIIFLGGSQGAKFINNFALEIAPELQKRGIKIIHQCGKNEIDDLTQAYQKQNIAPTLFAFSPNLHSFIQEADFAVSRAGASSLWELSANGLPSLFVPYPYAAKNHQFYNAEFLVKQNLAYLTLESDLDCAKLLHIIEDTQTLAKQSQGLMDTIQKGGAKDIAKSILALNQGYNRN